MRFLPRPSLPTSRLDQAVQHSCQQYIWDIWKYTLDNDDEEEDENDEDDDDSWVAHMFAVM